MLVLKFILATYGVVAGTASNLISQQHPIPASAGNKGQLIETSANEVTHYFESPICWLEAANALITGDANSGESVTPCRMEGDERSRFVLELTRCYLASTGRSIGLEADDNERQICSGDYDISSSEGLRRYLSTCFYGLGEIIFGQIFNDSFYLCERVLAEARYKRELEVFSDIAQMLDGESTAFRNQSEDPLKLIKDINRKNQELLRHQEDMIRHWSKNEDEFKAFRSKVGKWQQAVETERKRLNALNPLSAMIYPVKEHITSVIYSSILPHLRLCAKLVVTLIITTATSVRRARIWLIAVVILQALFQLYIYVSKLEPWSVLSDGERENVISKSETASLVLGIGILYVHGSRYHRKRQSATGFACDLSEPLSDRNIEAVYQQLILQNIMRNAPNDLSTTVGLAQSRNAPAELPLTHVLPRDILSSEHEMSLMHSSRSIFQEHQHPIYSPPQHYIYRHESPQRPGMSWVVPAVAPQPSNQRLIQLHSPPEIVATTPGTVELPQLPSQHQRAQTQSNAVRIIQVVAPQNPHEDWDHESSSNDQDPRRIAPIVSSESHDQEYTNESSDDDDDSDMRVDEKFSCGRKRKKRDECAPDSNGINEFRATDGETSPPKIPRRR